jgi:hypothetical protein
MDEQQPEFYEILPEFNSAGRLCNYHTGYREGESAANLVTVPAGEWERFNMLAGRQHKIVNGVVVYDETLGPCLPDPGPPSQLDLLTAQVKQLIAKADTQEKRITAMDAELARLRKLLE